MSRQQQDDEAWKRQAAMGMGKQLANQAMDASSGVVFGIKDYVERGPEGVSWLCFVGGLLTTAFGILGVISILGAVTAPIQYLVNIYIMLMGVVTCLIEAPVSMVTEGSTPMRWQKWCHHYFKFLTNLAGRGVFYLFQGSLPLSFEGEGLATFLAWYMFGLGILCIIMHYKIIPEHMIFGQKDEAPEYITVGA